MTGWDERRKNQMGRKDRGVGSFRRPLCNEQYYVFDFDDFDEDG